MNFIKEHKDTLLIGILIVVAIFGYMYFFTGEESPGENIENQRVVGEEVFQTLEKLQALNFSRDVLNNPVLSRLQDPVVELPNRGVGRSNPFISY